MKMLQKIELLVIKAKISDELMTKLLQLEELKELVVEVP